MLTSLTTVVKGTIRLDLVKTSSVKVYNAFRYATRERAGASSPSAVIVTYTKKNRIPLKSFNVRREKVYEETLEVVSERVLEAASKEDSTARALTTCLVVSKAVD